MLAITNYERLKEKVFRQDKLIANLWIKQRDMENRMNKMAAHPIFKIKEVIK